MTKPITRLLGNKDWVGKLDFQFFDGDSSELKIDTLPFYENPKIGESQSANYAKLSPIGRAGNLFAYLGANSRTINLTFNIRLPHVTQIESHYQGAEGSDSFGNAEKAKDILDKIPGNSKFGLLSLNQAPKDTNFFDEKHLNVLKKVDEESFNTLQSLAQLDPLLDPASDGSKVRRDMINKIAKDINLVRSSVVNNASKSYFGPPIVRLTFGILYQNVPCICTDYKVRHLEEGYDDTTLLPRGVEISMTLQEARNLGQYDKTSVLGLDSLAGWEVRFDEGSFSTIGSMDPGMQYEFGKATKDTKGSFFR